MQKQNIIIKEIRNWIKENKVIDVVMFGSFVRGKTNPSDIDLCIIITNEQEKNSIDLVDNLYQLEKKFQKKFHVSILTTDSIISGNTLANTLITEGLSIKNNMDFSKIIGFTQKSIFTYNLSRLIFLKIVSNH